MKLPKVLEDLSKVDEAYHALYEEKGGKYHLKVEIDGYIPKEDVEGLVKNRDKALDELKSLKAKFKDIDPEKYAELVKAEEEMSRKKLEAEQDWKAIEGQIVDKYEKKLKKVNDELEASRSEISRLLVDQVATEAIAKAKGSVRVLLPHVKNACRCVQDEKGSWKVEVLGEDGRPKVNPSGTGPMTISELVEEYKNSDEFGVCFAGNGATGGGATGEHGRDSGAVVLRGADASDPRKYRAAKAEAEKRGVRLELQE